MSRVLLPAVNPAGIIGVAEPSLRMRVRGRSDGDLGFDPLFPAC